MAVAATTIWTDAIVKTFLDLEGSAEDTLASQLADLVTELLENLTGRLFVDRTHTEIRTGNNKRTLVLNHRPIGSITSVTVLRAPYDSSPDTIASTDRRIDLQSGILYLNNTVFTQGHANVTVVYVAGYGAQGALALARDVYGAGLMMMKIIYDQLRSGALASTSLVMGGASFTVNGSWPVHVQNVINSHKRADMGSQ